jgi:hypothetical protein
MKACARPAVTVRLGNAALLGTTLLVSSANALAQGGQWQWSGSADPSQMSPPPFAPPGRSDKRDDGEIGVLYVASVAYGVGMGIWFSAELGIDDPGVFLIPPAILGIAAPVGVWFLDDPAMPSGLPAAIATGMFVGAGEGIGIASYQFVTADEDDAWGFKGLSRATALGATLGGVGGYALGYFQEPSPKSSLLVSSGVMWGSAIGAMFGYGASEADIGYGRANDSAGLGGLIGFNLGLAATAAISMVYIPSWEQIGWMWAGAGIGTAVSLPIFLFYAGEDTPPAKRGFLFMGTAVTLGIAAGAVFGGDHADDLIGQDHEQRPAWAKITHLVPMTFDGGAGVGLAGELF